MAEERTAEDVEAELEQLKKDIKSGEEEFDQGKIMNLIIEREILLGNLTLPLPGLAGTLAAKLAFVKSSLAGLDELAKEFPDKAATILTETIAKQLQFIMITASIMTGGLIPAPPNIAIVILFLKFLQSLSEPDEEKTDGNGGDDEGGDNNAGNLV